MDLRTRQGKLNFAGIVKAKNYKLAKAILIQELATNPFNPEEISKKTGRPITFPTTPQDYFQRLYHIIDNAEAGTLNQIYKNGKIKNISIFADGNEKLKFLNYSTMPIITCPGAGECKSFCYSLNSLRYFGAFSRWLLNTLLEQEAPEIIREAFYYNLKRPIYQKQLKEEGHITFRLYNDGDFPDLEVMGFWMDLIKDAQIKTYGYSKSWKLFLDFVKAEGLEAVPNNYKLNLSSGSKYQELYKKQMLELPFVRGEFIGISVNRKVNASKITKEEKKELRQKAKAEGHKKVFICAGVCYQCTSKGHACSLDEFQDFAIVTPIH
jgi:hypothetical protein